MTTRNRKAAKQVATIHTSRCAIHMEEGGYNAIALPLDMESGAIVHDIEQVGGIEIEYGVSGYTIEEGDRPFDQRCRRATNEECAAFELTPVLPFYKISVDLRKPIPGQVARWFRSLADKLNAAAAKIDAVDDDRDLKTVRKLIAGKLAIVDYDDETMEYKYEKAPCPPETTARKSTRRTAAVVG